MPWRLGLAVLSCALLTGWWIGGARGEPMPVSAPASAENRAERAAPAKAAGETFPYRAAISLEPAQVRSGPGDEFYETGRLRLGDEVEVHRHDSGGWCAIRPPPGSFSYMPAEYLKPLDEGLAETTVAGVKSFVGSSVGSQHNRSHVSLRRGEQVELLEKPPTEGLCRIAPPAGEFRWVRQECLERLGPFGESEPSSAGAIERGDEKPATRSEKWRAAPRTTAFQANDSDPADAERTGAPRGGGTDQWLAARGSPATDGAAHPGAAPSPRLARRPTVPQRGWIRPSPAAAQEDDREPAVESTTPSPAPSVSKVEGIAPGETERGGDRLIGATLDEIDLELAKVVCQPKDRWAFDQVRDVTKEVLRHAETAGDRARARRLLDRIGQFEEVRRQTLGLPATILDEPSFKVATTAARHLSMAERSRLPSSAALAAGGTPSRQAEEASSTAPLPPAAPLPPNWEDPRFDGSGRLVPLEKRGDGDPQFLLVDDQGVARYFVTAAPGVNLRGYRDRIVGITGSRSQDAARGKPHLTAQRVTLLGDVPPRR